MPTRAILFDLDGTLIDQFEAIYKAFSQVIEEMGFLKPNFETVKKAVGGASEATMTKLIGKKYAVEAVQRLRPIFEKEMLNGLKALPGSIEILRFCKNNNIRTAVLTNKHGPHARTACEYLNFVPPLEFVLGANDTKWKKPDPELTLLAIDRIKSTKKETIYIGDSPYDYNTAQNAGIPCSLVSTGTHSKLELEKLCECPIYENLISLLHSEIKFLV